MKVTLPPKRIVAPSILACDFTSLGEEIETLNECRNKWIHIDVMDGLFTRNIAIGIPVIQSISKKFPSLFLDCHLMCQYPDKWIENFVHAGASQITVHIESLTEIGIFKTVERIQTFGIRAGIALKPETPYEKIADLISIVDLVLVMTVAPGWGGQKFLPETLKKVRQVRDRHPNVDIQVDGGINRETASLAVQAGANVLVAGSALFGLMSKIERLDFYDHCMSCE